MFKSMSQSVNIIQYVGVAVGCSFLMWYNSEGRLKASLQQICISVFCLYFFVTEFMKLLKQTFQPQSESRMFTSNLIIGQWYVNIS